MTIRDYSATATDNTAVAGIGLSDAMLANALDNAIRALMADSANFLLDIAKPTTTTGSANAYALSTGGTVTAYEDKIRLAFRASFSNTGACTINVDTLGLVAMKVYGQGGVGDPASGQIQSGGVYDVVYVSSLGSFVVLNPTPIAHVVNLVEDLTPQLGGVLDTSGNQIRWSKGADVASAAALTLGSDGNMFDITGTTTITSIVDLAIGTTVILRFDSALTLTHDVTKLNLIGGASITVSAGDVAIFTQVTAAIWDMVSFASSLSASDAQAGTSTTPRLASAANIAAAIVAQTSLYEKTAWTAGLPPKNATTATAHSLGAAPDLVLVVLECTTAEHGFAVGDTMSFTSFFELQAGSGVNVYGNASNLYVERGNYGWVVPNAPTYATLTETNWKHRLIAEIIR